MTSAGAAGIFGALVAIAYVLVQIDSRLKQIVRELERSRQDNAAWRETLGIATVAKAKPEKTE